MRTIIYTFTLLVVFVALAAGQPRDCVVSEWTSWSPCSGNCYSELYTPKQVRHRDVLVYATLNGTRCPALAEWRPCGTVVKCPVCNCSGCHFSRLLKVGSSSWCRCCASGLNTNCHCPGTNYDFDQCVEQGWGTTYCDGYMHPFKVPDYCESIGVHVDPTPPESTNKTNTRLPQPDFSNGKVPRPEETGTGTTNTEQNVHDEYEHEHDASDEQSDRKREIHDYLNRRLWDGIDIMTQQCEGKFD